MSDKTCKCCGQLLPDAFEAIAAEVGLTASERIIFLTVANGPGRSASYEALIQRLWGGDPDGGPLGPHRVIYVFVARANRKLAVAGYCLRGVWGVGYRLDLVPVSEAA